MKFIGRTLFVSALAFLLFSVTTTQATVLINEVLFDPSGVDTGGEWVEIFNSADSAIDMSGWQLYPDGIGYFVFPHGFSIPGKSFMTVHLRSFGAVDDKNLYHDLADENMGNSSGSIALFRAGSRNKENIVSFLRYQKPGSSERKTWESTASDAGIWVKGNFIDLTSFEEGSSVGLRPKGNITRISDWIIMQTFSPNSTNIVPVSPESGDLGNQVSVSSFATSAPYYAPLSISADASGANSAVAGEEINFFGKAFGLSGQPLEKAGFIWNFGDSTVKEGRNLTHHYNYSGKYTVILTVSSGEYSASDSLIVEVASPNVLVSEYLPGKDGWIEIFNASSIELDISGWRLSDGSSSFIFPPHTILASNSLANFSARATSLNVKNTATLSLKGGSQLSVLRYLGNVPAGSSVIRNSAGIALVSATPTPGSGNLIVKEKTVSVPYREEKLEILVPVVMPTTTAIAPTSTFTQEIIGTDKALSQNSATNSQLAAAGYVNENFLSVPWLWLAASGLVGFGSGLVLIFLKKQAGSNPEHE